MYRGCYVIIIIWLLFKQTKGSNIIIDRRECPIYFPSNGNVKNIYTNDTTKHNSIRRTFALKDGVGRAMLLRLNDDIVTV